MKLNQFTESPIMGFLSETCRKTSRKAAFRSNNLDQDTEFLISYKQNFKIHKESQAAAASMNSSKNRFHPWFLESANTLPTANSERLKTREINSPLSSSRIYNNQNVLKSIGAFGSNQLERSPAQKLEIEDKEQATFLTNFSTGNIFFLKIVF